jgi:transcriptional regulator GlxA family with amidase domain
VSEVRLDAARRALEETDDTVDAIAHRCGFGTGETLRRTFARRLGVSPDAYRRRFATVSATRSAATPARSTPEPSTPAPTGRT